MIKFHENNDMKLFNICASCGANSPEHIMQVGSLALPLCRDCIIDLMNEGLDSLIRRGQDFGVESSQQARQMLTILHTERNTMPFERWLRQLSYIIPRVFKFTK